MIMNRKDAVLFLLLFVVSVGIISGSYYLLKQIQELRATERSMLTQKMQLELQMAEKVRQIEVFKRAISRLERYQVQLPENDVDFYSWVQQKLTDNGVRSNVVKPAKSPAEREAVQVDFQGPYYSFVRTLSDWRNLKVALRLASLRLESIDGGAAGGVAIVESVIKR